MSLDAGARPPSNVESLATWMLSLEDSSIRSGAADEALMAKLQVRATIVAPGDTVYCPCGWLVAVKVLDGSLIYGLRKSRVVATDKAVESLQACIKLYEHSGKVTTRLAEVLTAMKTALAAAS